MATEADTTAALRAIYGTPDENGAFSGAVKNDKEARVKYWRKPSGEITIGPDVNTDAPKFQQYIQHKRFQELPDSFGKETAGVRGGLIFRTRVPAGTEHHWLKPFMDNGGLTYICKPTDPFGIPGEYLLTKEQIVSLHLHRIPQVVAVRPDLEDVAEIECPYACINEKDGTRRRFPGVTREVAQRSVDQHIIAQHKEAVASRAVGDTIAQAMQNFQGGQIDANAIGAIVAAVMQAMNGTEKAAVAAIVQEKAAEPEVTDPALMSRPQLMSYASKNGIPRPDGAMKMGAEEWREYVLSATAQEE
ncbi:MAG: hypothetical protein WC054_12175 [Candidatus Nanopelagicales bacterium]